MSRFSFIGCLSLLNLLLVEWTWASSVSMSPSTVCSRAALDICLAELAPLLDSPLVKGFPQTPEAISVACRAFKGGMGCIDRYKENCLPPERQELLEKRVSGARHVMKFLCEDQVFQTEFLQHQQCFRVTAKDWEHCSYHFQKLVAEELQQNVSRADQNLGLCCAKHGFLRCVFYSSQFRCRKDASLFLMRVAQTLTDVQVHEDACRRIQFEQVCTGENSADRCQRSRRLLWIVFSLWMIVVIF